MDDKVIQKVRELIEIDCNGAVEILDIKVAETFNLNGEVCPVLSVKIDNTKNPELWVVFGLGVCCSYGKINLPTPYNALIYHINDIQEMYDQLQWLNKKLIQMI